MVFPLKQLVILLVKQASKPIANSVKTRAKSSLWFKNLCVGFAQSKFRNRYMISILHLSWKLIFYLSLIYRVRTGLEQSFNFEVCPKKSL